MIRKLFRTGRSLAVSVPGEYAEALGVTEGDLVTLEIDAGARALLVWPAGFEARALPRAEYRRQVASYLAAYGPALAALEAAAGEQSTVADPLAPKE